VVWFTYYQEIKITQDEDPKYALIEVVGHEFYGQTPLDTKHYFALFMS
jgi:hypothetical protein